MIASNLLRSQAIPAMPNASAKGNETIISNPPRAARGLPHPGRIRIRATIVTAGIASKMPAIFPKRIFNLSQNAEQITSHLDYISLYLSSSIELLWQPTTL